MPVPMVQPEIVDSVVLARYPFLPQATPWIKSLANQEKIDLDSLISGPSMEEIRTRGRLRLVESISNEGGVDAFAMKDIHTPNGQLLEAFSFYYARLVVCSSENDILLSRWAQAEAERAEKLLAFDEHNMNLVASTYLSKINDSGKLSLDSQKSVAKLDSRRWSKGKGIIWEVGLSDFIELSPKITGKRWRLVNQDVRNGWILLDEENNYSSQAKLARLLRERIKGSILEEARKKSDEVTDDLAIRLADVVGMVVNLLEQHSREAIQLSGAEKSDWPPCMNRAINELSQGVNVNHFGRLFLAAMATTIGLEENVCVEFFRNAPDFSIETTSYQVNQIFDRGYTPSGCAKLKLNACCAVRPGENWLCDQEWMDHPLKYMRARQRRRVKEEGASQEEKTVESNEMNPNSRDD